MSKPEFVYTTYIETTLEKLWQALTDGDFTERYWFGHRVISNWEIGSAFSLANHAGAKVIGKVLELDRSLEDTLPYLYALLGVPLRVTLGYPSADGPDPAADPEMSVGAGFRRDGFSPAVQADWATAFASVALCKPTVQGVLWTHFSDAEPHQFPHCGLLDARGNARPVLQGLREQPALQDLPARGELGARPVRTD